MRSNPEDWTIQITALKRPKFAILHCPPILQNFATALPDEMYIHLEQ